MATWQIQQAKTRFSELVDDANQKGPQIVTRHGVERAVVLSMKEYRALTAPKLDLRDFLLSGPKFDDIDIARDQDSGRESIFLKALCEPRRRIFAGHEPDLGNSQAEG